MSGAGWILGLIKIDSPAKSGHRVKAAVITADNVADREHDGGIDPNPTFINEQ
jgi:hypothetical protein